MLPLFVRRIVQLLLVAAVAMIVWILIAPSFSWDEVATFRLQHNRDEMLSGAWVAFFVPLPLSMLLGVVVGTVLYLLHRNDGWSDAWLRASTATVMVIWPLFAFVLAIANFSVDLGGTGPGKQIVHVAGITLDDSYARRIGEASPLNANARMSGAYISSDKSIWKLDPAFLVADPNLSQDFPPALYFKSDREPVSDVFVRGRLLLAVAGSELLAVDTNSDTPARLARLPFSGMRIGQSKRSFGAASELLLFGNDEGASFVYELRPNGQYAKLMQGDQEIVGATGCIDETFVAFSDRVLGLRPGHKPVLLFRAPGKERITSILARQYLLYDKGACSIVISTANAIFVLQDGVATILLAGVGGQLAADEDERTAFQIVDPARDVIVGVTIEEKQPPHP